MKKELSIIHIIIKIFFVLIIIIIWFFLLTVWIQWISWSFTLSKLNLFNINKTHALEKSNYYFDNFNIDKRYEEVWEKSRNFKDKWWVNSWGYFFVKDWKWSTIQWELKKWSKMQSNYAKYKWWEDTDWWFHPQNIFRLILNKKFKNFNQLAYFKVNKYNLSDSDNRMESNWFFLFNRYIDSDNLYYTWLRVDWNVVIKKKLKWDYYTLALAKIFKWKYDRKNNPNLIPINKWMGLRSKITNLSDDSVSIKVYTDIDNDWKWKLILNIIDTKESSWKKVINNSWYTWVRTDFMDVEIDKYYVWEI